MAGFTDLNPSPVVDSPPAFYSGTAANGVNSTISFANVTSQIVVTCTSDSSSNNSLLVAVTTAGLSGTARYPLPVGTSITLDCRVKKLELAGGGGNMGYAVAAVLTRHEAADYPDLTTANGFAGV